MYLKMHLPKCLCMSVLLMITNGFVVQSPSGPLVVPLGGSVVLPCSVDTLLPVEGLEVEWKRDSGTLVHLFQDGESRPEAQHQDYYDRAHFFTEEIQHGNFSLLLNNVRVEDKGEYRCKVYTDQDSDENVVEIKYVERLIVSGSNHSISPYEGEDVTLSCSVDSHIPPEKIEEVSWKKIDKDGEILVLLFQYNEVIMDSTPDKYKDRAEFFADEIPKANFSLRLKSVRTEDKGVYMCLVFAGDFSANTTMEVKISISTLHIVVLLLCGLAFGSAFLLGCLVWRKFNSEDFRVFSVLGWSFHLLPTLFMVTAFIIWGFIDGALNEVISCSALNLLRPLLLMVTVPEKVTVSWIRAPITGVKHVIFSVVFYAVLFHNAWERWTFYHQNTLAIFFIMFFLALIWLFTICYGAFHLGQHLDGQWGHALIIQFYNIPTICLLHYSFGQTREETLILPLAVVVVVIFLMIARTCWMTFHKFCWSMVILIFVLLESGVMVYHHYSVLEHEKDRLEWTCVAAFVQTLTMMVSFKCNEYDLGGLSRFVMYMIGAVGLIFLNSFALGTQLILNSRRGEMIQEDLRVIVFPAEGAFVLCWLAYLIFSYGYCVAACKKREALNCWNKPLNKHRSNQKDTQDPPESLELQTLYVFNERNG